MLNLNHTDASGNYQLSPAMDSVGLVNVNGSGTTTLPGNNSYFGITSINAGTLRAGADTGLSPSSDFVVAAGDTLDASTYSPTVLSLDSGGVVTLAAGGRRQQQRADGGPELQRQSQQCGAEYGAG